MAVLGRTISTATSTATSSGRPLEGRTQAMAALLSPALARIRRDITKGTVIPFWVAVILIIIAVVGVIFTAFFWYHFWLRSRARRAAEQAAAYARPEPLPRYRIPTLYFQHDENDTQGYLSPLFPVFGSPGPTRDGPPTIRPVAQEPTMTGAVPLHPHQQHHLGLQDETSMQSKRMTGATTATAATTVTAVDVDEKPSTMTHQEMKEEKI